jgi:hypothetical protein
LPVPSILAAARSASFSSSSLWFCCFAANQPSQHDGCGNTFAVPLTAIHEKQIKAL